MLNNSQMIANNYEITSHVMFYMYISIFEGAATHFYTPARAFWLAERIMEWHTKSVTPCVRVSVRP